MQKYVFELSSIIKIILFLKIILAMLIDSKWLKLLYKSTPHIYNKKKNRLKTCTKTSQSKTSFIIVVLTLLLYTQTKYNNHNIRQ